MATTSPGNFKLIIDAFDDYAKQVGEDLTKNPLADALRACDSPTAVLELLQDKAYAFKDYRDGDHKLISWLKPVVQVVQGFSGILGDAISFVSRIRRFFVVSISAHLPLGPVSTSECNLCQCERSPRGTYPVIFVTIYLPNNWKHQAASGVSSSYDSLVDLFECLGNFLKRLEIYTAIPVTPMMTEIIVKIMVELLSVLALATKQVKQGRLSE
jgi:hypothetical protein